MKLRILPARTGAQWVRTALRTFFRQPLALGGLFFMFVAIVAVVSLVPVLGSVLALGLLPSATLGLMAATREASQGRFPMPLVLLTAWRGGPEQTRAMVVLGALYAGLFLIIMGVSALIDGGDFARVYLLGEKLDADLANQSDFQAAMWVSMALYLPLSLMFWHAPALVHWHRVSPVKALFFSLVACLRNFGAYFVFAMVWMLVFMGAVILVSVLLTIVSVLLGQSQPNTAAMVPVVLLMAAMFMVSTYFTFLDTFEHPEGPLVPPVQEPPHV